MLTCSVLQLLLGVCQDVLDYKRAVPFTMFTGGVGRHPQGKLPISKDYMGDPSSKTVRQTPLPPTPPPHLGRPLWFNELK